MANDPDPPDTVPPGTAPPETAPPGTTPPDTAPPGTASASSHEPELTALPPGRDVVRNAGRAVLSVHHWRARFVLWTAAVAVGVVAVAFAKLADVAQLGLRRLL